MTGSQKRRDPRFPPFAFTEHGAVMAAAILNSPCAVETSVYVVRAFVQLRELLASNTELARRLDELERKLEGHDAAITAILSAIRELMNPPEATRRGIGFTPNLEPTTWVRVPAGDGHGSATMADTIPVAMAHTILTH